MTNGKRVSPQDKNGQTNPAVSKLAKLQSAGGGVAISWADVSGPALKAAIVAATEAGGAVILSKTSDGGALSITLLAGKERTKHYVKSTELATSLLEEIRAVFNE